MSQLFDMVTNAKVAAMSGEELGEVIGVHITGGRLLLVIDVTLEELTGDDPGGRESEVVKFPKAQKTPFRVNSGGDSG